MKNVVRWFRSAKSDLARMAAPWLAVGIGWLWLHNGWFALGLYHLQVLGWLCFRPEDSEGAKPKPKPTSGAARKHSCLIWQIGLVLASALAGPLFYRLGPQLLSPEALAAWFEDFGLWSPAAGWGRMLLLVFWFGLLHPPLEQLHWQPLWHRHGWRACAFFGGYHGLVLASLLGWPLALAVALGLVGMARLWECLGSRRWPWPAQLSHSLADLGLVIAALALVAAS